MAGNRIPQNYEPLVLLLEQAIGGAEKHGADIGLKQNDAAALRAALDNLTGPAGGLKTRWEKARAAKPAATAALRTAENQGRALVSACLGILKPRLGNQWNAAWREAGFVDGSLQVPSHPLLILRQLAAYFSEHPDHAVDPLSCTAAGCQAAAEAIAAADAASRDSNHEAGVAKQALAEGIQNARSRLTGLRAELGQLLADDDPRWFVFGFDRPGDATVPEIPANLVVTAGAPGTLFADWDDARRADGYRATVMDADGKVLAERLVAESEAMFADLPAGAKVKVVVTARNEAGESRACQAIEGVVG